MRNAKFVAIRISHFAFRISSMSTLTLVRHGQAMPFQKESDRLSPVGEAQSQKLGEFWARQRLSFDEVYTGPLLRQRQTAELAAATAEEARLSLPPPVEIQELSEYDSNGILERLAPQLAERDPEFKALVEAFERAETRRNRHFQRMFEVVVLQWLEGTIDSPDVEPWPAFRDRVQSAIRRITEGGGGGRRIAVFTSGGPIGVAVQLAVGAPDRSAIEINWRVRNCSLTEFVFGGGRFSLDCFNAVPHLDEPSLWTFR
ncbi:MAG TPA: histidine phosphatase family protein [Blastocatellia bacterium]|jgi:broad specificity phosphatase PhoE|nr:histidine phosphatase family protein [Blastocatellia bacterium]